ncbi:MAG: hypothetical protein OXC19_15735 [Bryobacterales bacterium]|nr:hypothetical protein [Bryobacterales bacterium]
MTPDELEALVSRKLGRLPTPQAPASLLPSVLAEARRIEARSESRLSRTGWFWAARAAMVAALVVVAALAGTAHQEGVFDDLWVLAGAIGLLWRVFVEPIIVPLAALVGLLAGMSALYCGALWSMLWERNIE